MMNMNEFIGIPFVDLGRDKKGCDCWGLALLLFKHFGIELPDYRIACDNASRIDSEISTQKTIWVKCDPNNPPVPSLLVIRFNSVTLCNHVGTYIGNHDFIHTARKLNSHITSIDSPAWSRRIEGFYVPQIGVES